MSSPTSSSSGSSTSSSSAGAKQFSVSDVHKVADACSTGSSMNR
jgi:hypothetical protein